MECFTTNYGEEFQDFLRVLTDLQEQLSDIRDCDVVEMTLKDYVQGLLDQEDTGPEVIGINALLLHYCEMRAAKYQAFLQQWEALEEADFKNQLLKIVSSRKN